MIHLLVPLCVGSAFFIFNIIGIYIFIFVISAVLCKQSNEDPLPKYFKVCQIISE